MGITEKLYTRSLELEPGAPLFLTPEELLEFEGHLIATGFALPRRGHSRRIFGHPIRLQVDSLIDRRVPKRRGKA